MRNERRTEILVAVGRDQRGVANEVTHVVAEAGCNIEETRMETLGGMFAVLMRVSGSKEAVAKVREHAPVWGRSKDFDVRMFDDLPEQDVSDTLLHTLRADAPDREGLVHALTEVLWKHQANFRSIYGYSWSAPFTGERIFTIEIDVGIPHDRVVSVKEDLDILGIDYKIELIRPPS